MTKKTIKTKFKVGDPFYTLIITDDGIKTESGLVDKIEVFKDYFRYVNENKEVTTNWFTNEQVDNEPKLKEGESQMERIFTSEEKALSSNAYKKARIYFLTNKIDSYKKELFSLQDSPCPK